jgi:hypothetical protein
VGLMNQAPTINVGLINQAHTIPSYYHKRKLDESSPYKIISRKENFPNLSGDFWRYHLGSQRQTGE